MKSSSRTSGGIDYVTYAGWKERALAELAWRHGIDARQIPEGIWRNAYVRGESPAQAADRAQVYDRTVVRHQSKGSG